MNSNIKVVLADPTGSGLFNKIKYGVMFSREESEGTRRRHQVDTVVEGKSSTWREPSPTAALMMAGWPIYRRWHQPHHPELFKG